VSLSAGILNQQHSGALIDKTSRSIGWINKPGCSIVDFHRGGDRLPGRGFGGGERREFQVMARTEPD
jgi:hypothetical protein